jgi:murein DD-endopeptidase MepM/ murein hydrolase activator NlpD
MRAVPAVLLAAALVAGTTTVAAPAVAAPASTTPASTAPDPATPAPGATPTRIGPGASGAQVRRLQARLRALGQRLPVTGAYDAATRRAVIATQQRLGLRPTGVVDQALLALLGLALPQPVRAAAPVGPALLRLAWPILAPITSGFGPRWGRMHEGIDLGAPTGTPVTVATSGVVVQAGAAGAYGNLVVVDHGLGASTAYAHLTRIDVSLGQAVSSRQTVGQVGSTGRSTGPHLHFEVRIDGRARDPMGFLPAR